MPTARRTSSSEPAEARGVLITRPSRAARETARRVEALGWQPVIAPCLEIVALDAGDATEADAVLVTSGNALTSALLRFQAAPLLAVGDATAAQARGLGFHDVRSARGDADALAALAAATLPPGARLLLPVGEGQGETLAARLAASGFEVRRRVAYRAEPPSSFPAVAAAALHEERLRAATFLSAETARVFARLMPARLGRFLGTVDALAISETAAAALHPLPWRRVRVSASPTLDGTLALL